MQCAHLLQEARHKRSAMPYIVPIATLFLMSTSQLRALLNIISTGIDEVENAYAAENKSFPTLDDPWSPESISLEEKLANTQNLVAAAAYQLQMLMLQPVQALVEASMGVRVLVGILCVQLLTPV
jgi:hypothetical protein